MSSDNVSTPRRRPSSGGYARGEEQRARLIEAALKVFGEEGYERASTRKIAQEAGVRPPALQYYFDSKEGLSRACGEYIVEQAMQLLHAPLELASSLSRQAPPEAALTTLCDLLDALVDASLFSKATPERARFSARTRTEDSPASAVMREHLSSPIADIATRLVAQVLGCEPGDEVRLRTGLILGQLSAVQPFHSTTLERLGWSDADGKRREKIKAAMRAHTRGALGITTI
ncbi:CerR family C-terminal domain-containing protein [Dyella sp. C9]|uniref:CerR family C-terminal domain-containing protein n=1 Tax=Dyella sp. C9 TaxID=2202154 RepID=UPI000DEF108A|nr:CerR family C-terminal domain-containing protein [Dyella sp. C9]